MKRTHLLGTVTGLLTLVSSQASDWPNYRGPSHEGLSPDKMAADTWPASGPRVAWKTPTPDGFSSFTVANGRAFTTITRDVDGAPLECVLALDARTGKELWAHPLRSVKYDGGGDSGTDDNNGGDGPRSTPVVDGEHVYALDGKLLLVCLEAGSGKEVWRKDVLAEHGGKMISWQNAASPVIEGGLVLVAGGGPGQALIGIDKETGRTVWKGQDDKMTHATPVPTTLHGVRQVIFFTQSGLVSVRPTDGAVLWRQAFPYKVSTAASPVVAGDIVYCSAGYGVGGAAYRISQEGGRFKSTQIWGVAKELQNHWSTPVYHDGHLYGLFGFKEYGACPLKCVELATGKVKWSKPGFGPGNVILVEGHLIVLGDAGQLVIADASPDEYHETAKSDVLKGKCWSTPAYADGRIFVRSTVEGACVDLNPTVAARLP
jgi:outer membrane protein assembly factor BamB